MDKPAAIRQLQTALRLELQPFPGPPEQLEELTRYRYQNHYALDAEGREVIGLNLRSNSLSDAQFDALKPFVKLQALNLSENNFTRMALPAEWTDLRYLDLSENKTLHTIELPRTHHHLEWLDLNECALKRVNVPNYLSLKKLDLSRNRDLEELAFVASCPELVLLDASDNKLQSFDLPQGFGALKYLYLNNNELQQIRFLHDLPSLEILHLRNNKLEYLPQFLVSGSPNMQALYVHGNPLRSLPEGTIESNEDASSWEKVKAYFLSLDIGQKRRNNEVKLVLLGNSTAGKSSLLRFLTEGTYDEQLGSTHGILNRIWQPEGRDFQVNVWDFGGQEYYHATHRLFLSKNAVSLVLFEKATNCPGAQLTKVKVYENGQLETKDLDLEHFHYAYWLDNVGHFSWGEIPVCRLVQTKMDLPDAQRVPVSEKDKTTYQLPDDTARISVKGAASGDARFPRDYENFRDDLLDLLEQSMGKYEISDRWLVVKREIRALSEDKPSITYTEYRDLCYRFIPELLNEDADQRRLILEYLTSHLHETGVILYYPNIPDLKDVVFINPEAVADGIYKVLDYSVIRNEGRFGRNQVEQVAGAFKPDDMLALMLTFQLIFEVKDSPGDYVAPQYLPDGRPSGKSFVKLEESCRYPVFTLRFPRFMPKSVISRVICTYGSLSRDEYWKNGILFRVNDIDVLVESNGQNLIRVQASQPEPEQTAEWFDTFLKIVDKHPDLEVSVDGTDFVNLKTLLGHPGENPVIQSVEGKDLSFEPFRSLFGGLEKHPKNMEKSTKKKVFVSYAHADGESFKNEMVVHLTTLREQEFIEDWNDRKIESGEWNPQIRKAVAEADIFLLMITPGFLASKYIDSEELAVAYEKYKAGEAKIFPVICEVSPGWDLKPVTRKEKAMHPVHKREMYIWLGRFQPYPKDGKAITTWDNRNAAFDDVYKSLLKEVL